MGQKTFVDFERNLNYCLTCIGDALADTAQSPSYIETLPRRGYRFIAPVEGKRPFAEPTVAVLPFANLNGDPAIEYFADGITDVLITELAHINAVISRQSILHLKGSGMQRVHNCRSPHLPPDYAKSWIAVGRAKMEESPICVPIVTRV